MTLSTFLLSVTVLAAVLAILKAFWLEIAAVLFFVWTFIKIAFWSYILMLLWVGFVTQVKEGWVYVWILFFLILSSIVSLFYFISVDLIETFGSWVRKFIKF